MRCRYLINTDVHIHNTTKCLYFFHPFFSLSATYLKQVSNRYPFFFKFCCFFFFQFYYLFALLPPTTHHFPFSQCFYFYKEEKYDKDMVGEHLISFSMFSPFVIIYWNILAFPMGWWKLSCKTNFISQTDFKHLFIVIGFYFLCPLSLFAAVLNGLKQVRKHFLTNKVYAKAILTFSHVYSIIVTCLA